MFKKINCVRLSSVYNIVSLYYIVFNLLQYIPTPCLHVYTTTKLLKINHIKVDNYNIYNRTHQTDYSSGVETGDEHCTLIHMTSEHRNRLSFG
jgi:hypothetical protein